MSPLIGVAQWCLDQRGVSSIARARELKIPALHIDYGMPGEADCLESPKVIEMYKNAADRYGVNLLALAMNSVERIGFLEGLTTADAKRCLNMVRTGIDSARSLGIKMVYLPSFHLCEIKTETDLERTAEFLQIVCRYADKSEVKIATENTLCAENCLKLVELVNHPSLQVLVDIYNPIIWGHDVLKIIACLSPFMCGQVHLKDGVNKKMGTAALGEGDGGFFNTMKYFDSIQFNGAFILENDYGHEAEIKIGKDIAAIKSCIQ